jgi:hypothetical protein
MLVLLNKALVPVVAFDSFHGRVDCHCNAFSQHCEPRIAKHGRVYCPAPSIFPLDALPRTCQGGRAGIAIHGSSAHQPSRPRRCGPSVSQVKRRLAGKLGVTASYNQLATVFGRCLVHSDSNTSPASSLLRVGRRHANLDEYKSNRPSYHSVPVSGHGRRGRDAISVRIGRGGRIGRIGRIGRGGSMRH